MPTRNILAAFFGVISICFSLPVRANAQEAQLRITSPAPNDVVIEGQKVRIAVAVPASVRLVAVVATNPLPDPRPIGDNQFELVVPKTVPPGRYLLTAMGVGSTEVESAPVSIQVERDDSVVGLGVTPPMVSFAELEGGGFPIQVVASFADGSHLNVNDSAKLSFISNDPNVATVRKPAMIVPVGPGQTYITIRYGTAVSAVVVRCPPARPKGPAPIINRVSSATGIPGVTQITIDGEHFGESQGKGLVAIGSLNGLVKTWSDTEIVATIPKGTHRGTIFVLQGGLYSNIIEFTPVGLDISAVLNLPAPGNQIRIRGSGFGSDQEDGTVTIEGIGAEIKRWSDTEITAIVPDYKPKTWALQLVVHRGGQSSEFRLVSAIKPNGN